ncbi:MAG: hypothetical protein LBG21_06895, partial [Campylobacteraceae bacterium]|nr:hypothetical protein [Campylobacteraceae bacterium]
NWQFKSYNWQFKSYNWQFKSYNWQFKSYNCISQTPTPSALLRTVNFLNILNIFKKARSAAISATLQSHKENCEANASLFTNCFRFAQAIFFKLKSADVRLLTLLYFKDF